MIFKSLLQTPTCFNFQQHQQQQLSTIIIINLQQTQAKAIVIASPRAWEALTPSLAEWILDGIYARCPTIPLLMTHKESRDRGRGAFRLF